MKIPWALTSFLHLTFFFFFATTAAEQLRGHLQPFASYGGRGPSEEETHRCRDLGFPMFDLCLRSPLNPLTGSFPLTEITMPDSQCGWSEISNFSNQQKKPLGHSPQNVTTGYAVIGKHMWVWELDFYCGKVICSTSGWHEVLRSMHPSNKWEHRPSLPAPMVQLYTIGIWNLSYILHSPLRDEAWLSSLLASELTPE